MQANRFETRAALGRRCSAATTCRRSTAAACRRGIATAERASSRARPAASAWQPHDTTTTRPTGAWLEPA
eukprot:6573751-Prymnesium_polylepis.1